MIFVCSSFSNMPQELVRFSRLYAFPTVPDAPPPDGFTLLDSGAFGLSMRGKRIDLAYMHRMATHYQKYGATNVLGIAPDVFPDPVTTMKNWSLWHSQFAIPVVPVIQMPRKGVIDLRSGLKQIEFYATQKNNVARYGDRPMLAISNPSLRGHEATDLKHIAHYARVHFPQCWIHVLGAGWDVSDLRDWASIKAFDSLDTIAYYTDAKQGLYWRGGRAEKGFKWRDIAVENALVAGKIAEFI